MNDPLHSLCDYALAIVKTPDPGEKVRLARAVANAWTNRDIPIADGQKDLVFPDHPGRPPRPELRSIRDMPRRRTGSKKGLIALVHSLAHIELNAIDMAFDFIARFADSDLPRDFLDEAVRIGLEEAQHFEMINARLAELGATYGDLPAHGGLWDATRSTRHDILARLAIVPLVLEARGLDVSPAMINQVRAAGETATASSMDKIYRDEITHVAFGSKWFRFICAQRGMDPREKFQELVRQCFRGPLKPPFNEEARLQAGLPPDFYGPLATF